MHTQLRVLILFALVALGVASADEAFAFAFAGGSRLEGYYDQSSADALTLATIINNNTDAQAVRLVVYEGSSCSTMAGPFTLTLAAKETRLFNVSDFAPTSTFHKGVWEAWAVDGSGTPVRFDLLNGSSIVVNTAGGILTGATVPAAKLFGDVRNGSGPITDQTDATTFAPLFITAPVLPQGGGLEDSIAVFSPATNPGTVPTATPSLAINFYTSGGTLTSTTVSNSCLYTNTLTGIFGGTAAGGGRVEVQASGDKGVVGWRLFKFTSGGIGLLLAELMQSWGTFSFDASSQ